MPRLGILVGLEAETVLKSYVLVLPGRGGYRTALYCRENSIGSDKRYYVN